MSGDSAPREQPPVVPGYQASGVVGRGPAATVYRARESAYSPDVAVKVFDRAVPAEQQADFERLRREVGTLSGHPSLATVLGTGTTQGRPYVVMELFERGSLATRVSRDGLLAPEVATALGAELLDALEVLHDAGVAHGAVTPHNVLISRYGRPLLSDVRLLDRQAATAADDLRAVGDLLASVTVPAAATLSGVVDQARAGGFATAAAFRSALAVLPVAGGTAGVAGVAGVDEATTRPPRIEPMPGTDPLTGPLMVTDALEPGAPPRHVGVPTGPLTAFPAAERTLSRTLPRVEPTASVTAAQAQAQAPAQPSPSATDESDRRRSVLLWLVPAALVVLLAGGAGAAVALAAHHHRDRPTGQARHEAASTSSPTSTPISTASLPAQVAPVVPSELPTPTGSPTRRHRHRASPSPTAVTTTLSQHTTLTGQPGPAHTKKKRARAKSHPTTHTKTHTQSHTKTHTKTHPKSHAKKKRKTQGFTPAHP